MSLVLVAVMNDFAGGHLTLFRLPSRHLPRPLVLVRCSEESYRILGSFVEFTDGCEILRASDRAPDRLALRYDWRNNSVALIHNFSAVSRIWLKVGMEGTNRQTADQSPLRS